MARQSREDRISRWSSKGYEDINQVRAARLLEYLDRRAVEPRRVLDIGAGLAGVDRILQQQRRSELWLLEGSRDQQKGAQRQGKWGSAATMEYYLDRSQLEQQWRQQGIQYHYVAAEQPHIDPDVKFDVITSWLSMGWHYPLLTYRELIRSHSHPSTVIVVDLRRKRGVDQQCPYRVVSTLAREGDYEVAHIEYC